MKSRRAWWASLCGCVIAASCAAGRSAWADAGAGSLDDQYHRVLVAMKKPAATGILVTEIEANSALGGTGAASNLWAGDVLYNYAGQEVHDLETLRRLVSESYAAGQVDLQKKHEDGDVNAEMSRVLVGVHRGEKTLVLQVERGPLGIRAIEVTADVPATPNPLASERGSFTPTWDKAIEPAEEAGYFRTQMGDLTLDWQKMSVRPVADEAIEGVVERHDLDANLQWADTGFSTVTYRLRWGDYQKTPVFFLDAVDVHRVEAGFPSGGANAVTTDVHVERNGLRGTGAKHVAVSTHRASEEIAVDLPANALPLVAVPVVAAALPHGEPNATALAVSLWSDEDFQSRPGYVLVARGKKSFGGGDRLGWQVDLMHCGLVVESCWFSEGCKLLQMTQYVSKPVDTRRVGSEEEATATSGPDTTTRPANTRSVATPAE